ncbi:MAG: hypothetical protein JNM68_05860 [Dinghuibacter sp.]|nr:hypothetical protein [Dinghuibacter sp.]
MKLLCSFFLLLAFTSSHAQKVGIGNTNPNMRLHVSSTTDTALLQIDNNAALANNSNVGLYLKNGAYFTGAIKTTGTGTNVARMGLYTFAAGSQNQLRERLSIADNGQVGINTNDPQAMLDVNGTVKISGGSPGAGKVLTSDATGNASWQAPDAPSCMLNVFSIEYSLSYTNFTVPAGITKVFVEMWGSGGNGSNSGTGLVLTGGGGGGGAYASFYLNVTPGSTIQGKVDATDGSTEYTVFKYAGDSVRCRNGGNASSGLGSPGLGGNVTFAYTGFTITTPIFTVNGEDGRPNEFVNYTFSGSSYTDYIGGNGGSSYKHFGQRGQVTRVNSGGTETTKAELSVFKGRGVGGGAITRAGGSTLGDNTGEIGVIYIYY